MRFDPLKVPGFVEAVLQERLVREDGLLGTPENVAGFELRKLTLRDLAILRMMRNPIIYDKVPSPVELAQFLWFMSVGYSPKAKWRRRLFLRKCKKRFGLPAKPFIETSFAMRAWRAKYLRAMRRGRTVINACLEYYKEARQDSPPTKGSGYTPSYYSETLYLCALLGREYGYSLNDALNMPLKAVYGFVAEIRQRYDPKSPQFNPSDKVIGRWLEGLNKKALEKN